MDEVIFPDWRLSRVVRAFATTRLGGASPAPFASFNIATHVGDEEELVVKNRRALGEKLPERAQIQWMNQQHGTGVIRAAGVEAAKADACWTDQPNQVCAVMTADCLPLLLAAKDGSCVAAVHAGWRGLANGVIESAIKALPVRPENLSAWLGPAIGPCHFEVGAEVRDIFIANMKALNAAAQTQIDSAFRPHPRVREKYFADLYQLARWRLKHFGVQSIFGGESCTYCDDRFFSFRAEGKTGRMVSLIWIETE